MEAKKVTSKVLSVRVSPQERDLLQIAANHEHSSVSDFVRHNALEAATQVLMERRIIQIPAEAWDEIDAYLAAPAKLKPELQSLAQQKTAWQD